MSQQTSTVQSTQSTQPTVSKVSPQQTETGEVKKKRVQLSKAKRLEILFSPNKIKDFTKNYYKNQLEVKYLTEVYQKYKVSKPTDLIEIDISADETKKKTAEENKKRKEEEDKKKGIVKTPSKTALKKAAPKKPVDESKKPRVQKVQKVEKDGKVFKKMTVEKYVDQRYPKIKQEYCTALCAVLEYFVEKILSDVYDACKKRKDGTFSISKNLVNAIILSDRTFENFFLPSVNKFDENKIYETTIITQKELDEYIARKSILLSLTTEAFNYLNYLVSDLLSILSNASYAFAYPNDIRLLNEKIVKSCTIVVFRNKFLSDVLSTKIDTIVVKTKNLRLTKEKPSDQPSEEVEAVPKVELPKRKVLTKNSNLSQQKRDQNEQTIKNALAAAEKERLDALVQKQKNNVQEPADDEEVEEEEDDTDV